MTGTEFLELVKPICQRVYCEGVTGPPEDIVAAGEQLQVALARVISDLTPHERLSGLSTGAEVPRLSAVEANTVYTAQKLLEAFSIVAERRQSNSHLSVHDRCMKPQPFAEQHYYFGPHGQYLPVPPYK